MSQNCFIFVPNCLNLNQTGYLQGHYRKFIDSDAYYITGVTHSKSKNWIGFLNSPKEKPRLQKSNKLSYDHCSKKVVLNGPGGQVEKCFVQIFYNLETFRWSKILTSESEKYGEHFKYLGNYLQHKQTQTRHNGRIGILSMTVISLTFVIDLILKFYDLLKSFSSSSTILNHFHENLLTTKWMLLELTKEKRNLPKIGNILLTKFLDLLMGFLILQYFIEHEQFIIEWIAHSRDVIIQSLRELLMYLMGSPIGLKLNKAINNCLGRFFFYNISLWMTFLDILQPIIEQYFNYFVLLGAFGVSFQIAILADLIFVATFHVYCIYIYASRLIYIQLKCLLSLWRLFIGRKYNPLRERVDSCQYTHHELFIGTLGFTILLFLVPTTTMYYTVFTIFRLSIIIIDRMIQKLRCMLHCLPLYVLILWIFGSSEVAGKLRLIWKETTEDGLIMEAKLDTLPLGTCVKKFTVDTKLPAETMAWNRIFQSVLTGTLI